MHRILHLLEQDARITPARIAKMLGITEQEVNASIHKYEKENVILGYKAIIDWDKVERDSVTALIEVRVSPQKGMGFDELARRIHCHKQVVSVYLMSGSFDFTVIINGRSLQEVSRFVSENLAPMENIISTSTHFVLKKYKDAGIDFNPVDEREDFRDD
ncbi:Lrp/AsnC family transcriptional regulator [Butyricicoccus sp.]|uniref:Lrp/AsnC family transcriptional regulator n=1 Tax=Butyricicoccus sp. TaxID=2049021 RepID=UPI0037367367